MQVANNNSRTFVFFSGKANNHRTVCSYLLSRFHGDNDIIIIIIIRNSRTRFLSSSSLALRMKIPILRVRLREGRPIIRNGQFTRINLHCGYLSR